MHKVEYVLVVLSKTIASATSDFVCNPCNPWSKQANTPEAARAQRRAKTSLSSCRRVNSYSFGTLKAPSSQPTLMLRVGALISKKRFSSSFSFSYTQACPLTSRETAINQSQSDD